MNSKLINLAGGLCVLALCGSGAVLADDAGTAPATKHAAMKSKSAKSAESPSERVEDRIQDMHAKLMITPDQEPKWTALTDIMRDNAAIMDKLSDERKAAAETASALDDLHAYSDIASAHAEGLKKFVPAFEDLYSSMSESQKKNADQLFRRHAKMNPKS